MGKISARVVRLRLVISSKKELRTRERKKNSAKDTASVAIQRIFRGWCAQKPFSVWSARGASFGQRNPGWPLDLRGHFARLCSLNAMVCCAQACTPGDPGADLRCRGRPGAVPWVRAAAALPGGPRAMRDHPEVCARLAGAAMVPARTAVRAKRVVPAEEHGLGDFSAFPGLFGFAGFRVVESVSERTARKRSTKNWSTKNQHISQRHLLSFFKRHTHS